ncbi:MAG: oxalate:formate antiporter [Acidobacteria bacterium]|nr:MAG: oxalate:formate antiporter [Acidobacteriota bacterium]
MNRWQVVAGGVSMNLALGSLYAWSVFVLPLEKEFGWTRAQTSWVFTIAVLTFAATFILAGRIQDARGPRICALFGAVLVSAGFFLASFTTSLLFLYVIFGVVVGAGNGFGYSTPTPVASKWFPDKRGLVVGLMVGGYGASSAILGPVATNLIASMGWRPTFRLLGGLFFVMGLIGAWLLKNPPAGYRPAGWNPQAAAATQRRDYSPGEMLRTLQFYFLWFAYCLGATAGLMTISQLVPFARSAGLTAAAATFAITVGAVGNAGGRILSGWLSDALGRLTTLRVMVLGSAVAMPALFIWREQVLLLYVLVAVVYWCYGTQLSVFASTTADLYGTRNLGMNYGLLFTAWGAAGIIGPIIAARVFDALGDYRYAFYAASALALVAFASLILAGTTRSTVAGIEAQPARAARH